VASFVREDSADSTIPNELLSRLDSSRFTLRHGLIYGTALAGHFLDGFVINLTGVVIPGVIAEFGLNSKQAGLLSSSLFLGMLVGAAVAGLVSDRLGRKFPLAVCLLFFAGFSLLAAFAWDYPSLLAARFCQGIGLGAEIAIVLPYITEFVPSRRRAPLLTMATGAWLIGVPVAALVGAAIVPAFSWRAMFVVGAVPILVSGVMMASLPESVRYLLRRGRHESARKIVGRLAVAHEGGTPQGSLPAPASPSPPVPDTRRTKAGSVRELLSRRYVTYTLSLWFMELCAGAFLYGLSSWLPSVLEKRGVSLLGSFSYTAIITGAGVLGALIAGHMVNRTGRRATIGVSFLLSGVLCLWWGGVSSTTAVVVLGSLATFFGSGFAGSTLFVYASELYPTTNRATGLGWAAAWQKAGGLVIPVIIGWILATHASGYVFFVLFAVISLLAGLSGLLATFETRGRTVEQITDALAAKERRGDPAPAAGPTPSLAGAAPAAGLAGPYDTHDTNDTHHTYDAEKAGEG
jgi:putative MFS transporter